MPASRPRPPCRRSVRPSSTRPSCVRGSTCSSSAAPSSRLSTSRRRPRRSTSSSSSTSSTCRSSSAAARPTRQHFTSCVRARRAYWSASAAARRTPRAKVLGIGVPMATAVSDVASARRDYMDESGGRYVHVICDGGMANGGDIAKAVACGADAVMIGMPLARATEAPGRGWHLGPRVDPRDAAARCPGQARDRRLARADPVRPVPRHRRHHEHRRRPPPRNGHDRLLRPQGVPACRGRRQPGRTSHARRLRPRRTRQGRRMVVAPSGCFA